MVDAWGNPMLLWVENDLGPQVRGFGMFHAERMHDESTDPWFGNWVPLTTIHENQNWALWLVDVPSGCRFHTRCHRVLGEICRTEPPPWRSDGRGNRIACHIPLDELREEQGRVFTFEPTSDAEGRTDG